MSEPPEQTDDTDRITVGDRVRYVGAGVYNGRRGRVEDIIGGHAKVQFRRSTRLEPLDCFIPIGGETE